MSALLPSPRLVLATAAVALVASLALAFSRPTTVSVDGQRITSDVAPVTSGGVVYLPVRAVTAAVGARTSFDARSGELTVRHGSDVLRMHLGQRRAMLNGAPYELSHVPFTVHGRVMLRGRDLAAALGSSYHYDARRDRVEVRTPGAVVAGAPDDN